MRKTIAAIIVTGVYLLTNLLSGEAAGPVETYQSWSDELKSYTQSVCDEYNVDYSLALGVIYNESRFQKRPDSREFKRHSRLRSDAGQRGQLRLSKQDAWRSIHV